MTRLPRNRRQFLRAAAVGAVAAPCVLQAQGTGDDLRMAVVGFRIHGQTHLRNDLKMPGVRVAGLCDDDGDCRYDRFPPLVRTTMRRLYHLTLTGVMLAVFLGQAAAVRGDDAFGPMIDNTHDRVQTTLKPGLKRIGTLKPRGARDVGRSNLAIGCEMLDRDYGNFENFKTYIEPLGIKRIRLQAGWAKTEKVKGVYNFAWLDRQVDYLCAQGMDVLIETSYGNPLYPGGGGASLGDGFPAGDEALAAWDAWIEALARHYQGRVRDWSTWNEPNGCKQNTPELVADNNIRTATIIKKHIPDARIAGLVLTNPNVRFAESYMKILRAKGKTGLFEWMIYHDYSLNPDAVYPRVEEFATMIHRYAPGMKVWQGEAGATSSPHYSAKISSAPWNSELTQCKWDARRMIGDLGHGIESWVFTFYDPAYDHPERYTRFVDPLWIRTRTDRFMKRMGLIKCNEDGKVLKVKPAYYTVQNVASVFDRSLEPVAGRACDVQCVKQTAAYLFRKTGNGPDLLAFWDCATTPENDNDTTAAQVTLHGVAFEEPVWVDVVTGAIYELPKDRVVTEGDKTTLKGVPLYDAPVLITDKRVVVY